MWTLCLRSDRPVAELVLFEDADTFQLRSWQADRQLAEQLPKAINDFMKEMDVEFSDLSALVVYEGPGSFTGLRIGISYMNALAYGLGLPLFAATDADWPDGLTKLIRQSEPRQQVLPEYGALPHITQPKR